MSDLNPLLIYSYTPHELSVLFNTLNVKDRESNEAHAYVILSAVSSAFSGKPLKLYAEDSKHKVNKISLEDREKMLESIGDL